MIPSIPQSLGIPALASRLPTQDRSNTDDFVAAMAAALTELTPAQNEIAVTEVIIPSAEALLVGGMVATSLPVQGSKATASQGSDVQPQDVQRAVRPNPQADLPVLPMQPDDPVIAENPTMVEILTAPKLIAPDEHQIQSTDSQLTKQAIQPIPPASMPSAAKPLMAVSEGKLQKSATQVASVPAKTSALDQPEAVIAPTPRHSSQPQQIQLTPLPTNSILPDPAQRVPASQNQVRPGISTIAPLPAKISALGLPDLMTPQNDPILAVTTAPMSQPDARNTFILSPSQSPQLTQPMHQAKQAAMWPLLSVAESAWLTRIKASPMPEEPPIDAIQINPAQLANSTTELISQNVPLDTEVVETVAVKSASFARMTVDDLEPANPQILLSRAVIGSPSDSAQSAPPQTDSPQTPLLQTALPWVYLTQTVHADTEQSQVEIAVDPKQIAALAHRETDNFKFNETTQRQKTSSALAGFHSATSGILGPVVVEETATVRPTHAEAEQSQRSTESIESTELPRGSNLSTPIQVQTSMGQPVQAQPAPLLLMRAQPTQPQHTSDQAIQSHTAQTQTTQTTAATTPHAVTAPISTQLLHHADAAKTAPVEVLLRPEELGHVKFQLHQNGDQVRIVLSAERAETFELLRRNSDQLLQEFRQAGFSEASLSFGQWSQQHKSSPSPENIPIFDENFVEPPTITRLTPQTAAHLSGQGLNLRL